MVKPPKDSQARQPTVNEHKLVPRFIFRCSSKICRPEAGATNRMVIMTALGVVDYEAGNIASITNALNTIHIPHYVSSSIDVLEKCSGILLPGVGAAPAAMRSLEKRGLIPFLQNIKVPFLGVCLGMQVLFQRSEEGDTKCLGILPGEVLHFDDRAARVPHMGWNQVEFQNGSSFAANRFSYYYFAHSFYVPVNEYTKAIAESGVQFSAACQKDLYYGVQFHPEKSGSAGLQLLMSFWKLCESFQRSI
jgi:glutamine amidotransferase